ncbi:cobyric acid synthase [Desulfobacterales bacterium HSG16]|nr:cobyric acid synthase [Desulfobacterales bacterium HSG16]
MNSKKNLQSFALAVFGTGSDVGKSVVATALCRFFSRQGISTAPYKAQNMSNNSGVTPEGLEMGRAQIVQAEAARIAPHVDMNPILLKPTSEKGAQVVLAGTAAFDSTAIEYHKRKADLFAAACAAFDRLKKEHEMVVIEGAGSCAEVNLMAHDIVNFKVAEHADAKVILVADIHRGGVFAQIVGTLACLDEKLKDRIAGFIINRFRGDLSLFDDGVQWLEQKTGKKVFGVLPWFNHIRIEAEDSVVIENPVRQNFDSADQPAIGIIRIPHISNFTDFDPLCSLEGVDVFFLEQAQKLSKFCAVILPGSKNTRYDLEWLKKTGWASLLSDYAKDGGNVLGICGGYQMMGTKVHDPDGLEGLPGITAGLDLLPVETFLKAPKTTTISRFEYDGICGTGYEIHMGQTTRTGGLPLFKVLMQNQEKCSREDGCITENARIMGTYMHGMFDSSEITRRWLAKIGLSDIKVDDVQGLAARDLEYEKLADYFQEHVDTKAISDILGL